MAINNIDDTYYKVISAMATNATKAVSDTAASSDSNNTDNSLQDSLELSSSLPDLAAYLNYNATGNYSNPSLADYLNSDSDNEDASLLDLLKTDNISSLTGIEDSDEDSDSIYSFSNGSISDAFQEIADNKTKEIDDQIAAALSKLGGSESQA